MFFIGSEETDQRTPILLWIFVVDYHILKPGIWQPRFCNLEETCSVSNKGKNHEWRSPVPEAIQGLDRGDFCLFIYLFICLLVFLFPTFSCCFHVHFITRLPTPANGLCVSWILRAQAALIVIYIVSSTYCNHLSFLSDSTPRYTGKARECMGFSWQTASNSTFQLFCLTNKIQLGRWISTASCKPM